MESNLKFLLFLGVALLVIGVVSWVMQGGAKDQPGMPPVHEEISLSETSPGGDGPVSQKKPGAFSVDPIRGIQRSEDGAGYFQ